MKSSNLILSSLLFGVSSVAAFASSTSTVATIYTVFSENCIELPTGFNAVSNSGVILASECDGPKAVLNSIDPIYPLTTKITLLNSASATHGNTTCMTDNGDCEFFAQALNQLSGNTISVNASCTLNPTRAATIPGCSSQTGYLVDVSFEKTN